MKSAAPASPADAASVSSVVSPYMGQWLLNVCRHVHGRNISIVTRMLVTRMHNYTRPHQGRCDDHVGLQELRVQPHRAPAKFSCGLSVTAGAAHHDMDIGPSAQAASCISSSCAACGSENAITQPWAHRVSLTPTRKWSSQLPANSAWCSAGFRDAAPVTCPHDGKQWCWIILTLGQGGQTQPGPSAPHTGRLPVVQIPQTHSATVTDTPVQQPVPAAASPRA